MNNNIAKTELINWLNDIGQRIFEIKNSRRQYDNLKPTSFYKLAKNYKE